MDSLPNIPNAPRSELPWHEPQVPLTLDWRSHSGVIHPSLVPMDKVPHGPLIGPAQFPHQQINQRESGSWHQSNPRSSDKGTTGSPGDIQHLLHDPSYDLGWSIPGTFNLPPGPVHFEFQESGSASQVGPYAKHHSSNLCDGGVVDNISSPSQQAAGGGTYSSHQYVLFPLLYCLYYRSYMMYHFKIDH